MFLVWEMNPAQHRDFDQIIYLMSKSRSVAKHELLSRQDGHETFVEYAKGLMDQVQHVRLSAWEVQHHLWAMHRTIEIRIRKVKDRQIWKGR